MPKVSVIMPVYNGARFLERAVFSVLNQSEKDLELIIIDDGSTEPVNDIIEKFNDNRIRAYRRKENQGLTKCLNECLALAKGDYIARFDADDICHKYRLAMQVYEFMRNPNAGLVGCWAQSINEKEELITHYCETRCRCDNEMLKYVYPVRHCLADPTSMYSREAVEKVGYFDSEVFNGETYNYNLRVQKFFDSRVVMEVLYYRTVRCDSIMRTLPDRGIDVFALCNKRANEFPII